MSLDMALKNPKNIPYVASDDAYIWELKSSREIDRTIKPRMGLFQDLRARYHKCIEAEFESCNTDLTVSYMSVHTPPVPKGYALRSDNLRIHQLSLTFNNGLLFKDSDRRDTVENVSFHISDEHGIYVNGNAMIRNIGDFVYLEKQLENSGYPVSSRNSQNLSPGARAKAENINRIVMHGYFMFIEKISSKLSDNMPSPFDVNLEKFLSNFRPERFYLFPFDNKWTDWLCLDSQRMGF